MKTLLQTMFFFLLLTQICFAQWVQSGPNGGSIYCFAVSDTNVFAGGAYGAFHSTNNGTSWTAVNSELTNTYVKALAVSGTNLFAGTLGGGVFRSTNSGASWTAVNSGLTDYCVQALAVSGTNLFAGTHGFIGGGVFLSTNNGTSWTEINSGLPQGNARDVSSFAMSGSNIFVGTHDGVFLSTNNGTNWVPVNGGLVYTGVLSLAVNGTNLFAGTNWGGVFLSTNNGTSWTAAGLPNTDVNALAVSGTNLFAGTSNGVFLSSNNGTGWMPADSGLTASDIRCFALKEDILFLGAAGSGVFLSTNNGVSWSLANSGLVAHPNVSSLSVSGANLFAGTYDDGVFLSSNNGTSWSPANSDLPLNVRSLAVSGPNLLAGCPVKFGARMSLSTDNGRSWTIVGSGITAVASGSTVLAATWYCDNMANWGEIILSTDEGINWTDTYFGYWQVPAPPCLAISGTNLFVGTAGYWPATGVFLSTDNGLSWTTVNSGLTDSNVVSLFVGGESLFAGTENGLFRSTNNGANWTDASAGLTGTPISFAVSANGTGGTILFAGTDSNGVFLSTNNGTSWAEVSTGLTDSSISSLSVSGTSLFAGTTSGVWRRPLSEIVPVELTSFTATTNENEIILSWSTATELNNQGFEIERASSKTSPLQEDWEKIGFVPGFGTTTEPKSYSYTDQSVNNGIYFYRLKQIDYDGSYEYSGVVEVKFNAVNLYLLEQNYPNPFNPITTIGFGIQNKSNVKITILNAIGEEVAVVLNEEREVGFHQVEFSAANLPSGVYFYRLQAGFFVETKKMVLMK